MHSGCGNNNAKQAQLRDQGIELLANGDCDGAIVLFDEALGMSVGKVEALEIDINYYKAAAMVSANRYEEAIECYNNLIAFDDKNYEAYFLRGSVYAKSGDVVSMTEDYNRALTLHRRDYELYIKIYENLTALGMSEQGVAYLNTALDLSDKSPESYFYRGKIYYLLGQNDSALEQLNTAMDKDVTEAKLYIAKVYQSTGDDVAAEQLLLEYASSEDVSSEVLESLGEIEMNSDNYDRAYEYFSAGLNSGDTDTRQHLLKGQIVALEYLGRFEEAREILNTYIAEYPDDLQAAEEAIFLSTR